MGVTCHRIIFGVDASEIGNRGHTAPFSYGSDTCGARGTPRIRVTLEVDRLSDIGFIPNVT